MSSMYERHFGISSAAGGGPPPPPTPVPEPRVVLLNPALAPAVPLLQALAAPGRLFEAWAVDLRDPSQSPPLLWLQIFDSVAVPVSGVTQPTVTALPLCCTAEYAWSTDAFMAAAGMWVALSSTPLIYTAVPANQLFSFTARVLP